MTDLVKLYKEAIASAELWRSGKGAFNIQSATPNELHIYNVFTQAKNQLKANLACIEDAQGTYMKGKK